MPAPISLERRQRIVKAYKAGHGSCAKLPQVFDISKESVQEFVRLDRLGQLEPKPNPGRKDQQKLFENHYLAVICDRFSIG